MCSAGDSTAKAAEQQQAQFSARLANVFEKQYSQQTDILNYLKGVLQPMIDKPTGYGDTAVAAMKTSATDNIGSQYDKAQLALNQSHVGQDPSVMSGVDQMQNGALKGAQAGDTAAALNTVDLNNENLKQQNFWNAVNGLSGNAAMFNPQSYAGASTGAAGAVSGLSQAVTASKQSQLMGALGGIAGGAGSALGGYFMKKK